MLMPDQAHGQKTAYALMVDGDHAVNGTWRLRLGAQRLQCECQNRRARLPARPLPLHVTVGCLPY